ncbi:sodium:solute symporter family protein [Oceanicoccus sagamiensis]|uniref:Sodium:solute symporter n=1 Tax=Oceanicoccus sagamiensis TaxID=716816 RepID=A0A1X9NAM9_9GAMM|nr:sodium:solute symporter family protein [Oceanicoccus sagamiensis]ARN75100.1 sodium:solute symporter [Oceanicoccus sagamiensis]
MKLATIDIVIILGFIAATLALGFYLSARASKNMQSYFLAGNDIPWYYLGLSNASGMFDVSGTMIAVAWLFVYGIKSAWIPWLWPVWNQIFMMVFLAVWMRRSNVLTGAEWITFRFGESLGSRLSHIATVIFAVVIVIAFMAYFVEGIGKFSAQFLPWDISFTVAGISISNEDSYALAIIAITTLYTLKGGFYSVVGTEVLQFFIMTIACLIVGYIALFSTTAEQIQAAVPAGWDSLWFGWELGLDWSELMPAADQRIEDDGYGLFGFLFMLMIFKGIFASLAGPVPSYDMQRVLGTRTPSEAAKMFGLTPIVLSFPRYFMIAGITVLALVYMDPAQLQSGDGRLDFEQVLPYAISEYVGPGFRGLLLAGLIAAFMSTFAAFINAGSAYVVNDIYRKYINDQADDKTYLRLSYIVTASIVVIGVSFGLAGGNIQARTDWIVGLLYGSYVASNMLKWIWWRFNGYGFFFGMVSGMVGVAIIPPLLESMGFQLLAIEQFPLLFAFALFGSLAGCLLTPAEPEEVLKKFYRQTRPWGFWKPIADKVLAEEPDFTVNKDFNRDMFNIVVGIIWQMTLVIIPIFLVIRGYTGMMVSIAVFALCTFLLKKYWWDRLED